MMEIEVKVPIEEPNMIKERIRELGAILVSERDQEDLYFSHPSRDLGVTDEALRLRRDGGTDVITYKGPKIDGRSKTREEIETVVDFSDMRAILQRLGFKEAYRIKKHRTEFHLEGVRICLDDVELLGSFLELEFEGQDIEIGLHKIEGLKNKLGIHGNETRSYLELLYIRK